MKFLWALAVAGICCHYVSSQASEEDEDLAREIARHEDWEDGVAVVRKISDPYGNPDDDEDDDAERGLWENIKTAQVKKKCECGGNKVCGCCIFLVIKNENSATACFNITEVPGEKKVEVALVLNDKKLYTKHVGEKDKCANIPYTASVAKICLSMYNMTVDQDGLRACLKLNIRLVNKEAVTFDFNCLLLGKGRLIVEKPSGKPNSGIINVNMPGTYSKIKNFFKKKNN